MFLFFQLCLNLQCKHTTLDYEVHTLTKQRNDLIQHLQTHVGSSSCKLKCDGHDATETDPSVQNPLFQQLPQPPVNQSALQGRSSHGVSCSVTYKPQSEAGREAPASAYSTEASNQDKPSDISVPITIKTQCGKQDKSATFRSPTIDHAAILTEGSSQMPEPSNLQHKNKIKDQHQAALTFCSLDSGQGNLVMGVQGDSSCADTPHVAGLTFKRTSALEEAMMKKIQISPANNDKCTNQNYQQNAARSCLETVTSPYSMPSWSHQGHLTTPQTRDGDYSTTTSIFASFDKNSLNHSTQSNNSEMTFALELQLDHSLPSHHGNSIPCDSLRDTHQLVSDVNNMTASGDPNPTAGNLLIGGKNWIIVMPQVRLNELSNVPTVVDEFSSVTSPYAQRTNTETPEHLTELASLNLHMPSSIPPNMFHAGSVSINNVADGQPTSAQSTKKIQYKTMFGNEISLSADSLSVESSKVFRGYDQINQPQQAKVGPQPDGDHRQSPPQIISPPTGVFPVTPYEFLSQMSENTAKDRMVPPRQVQGMPQTCDWDRSDAVHCSRSSSLGSYPKRVEHTKEVTNSGAPQMYDCDAPLVLPSYLGKESADAKEVAITIQEDSTNRLTPVSHLIDTYLPSPGSLDREDPSNVPSV